MKSRLVLLLAMLALVALGAGLAAAGVSRLAAFGLLMPVIAVVVVVYLRRHPPTTRAVRD